MTRVLLTAFEPYDRPENSSWLCLQEVVRDLPSQPVLTTRRYPVDFDVARERLHVDLQANYDYCVFLGQAPGLGRIHLEALAINVRCDRQEQLDTVIPLEAAGPPAYATRLPIGQWAAQIRGLGIPAAVSFHAGTYLCNGVYYWAQHFSAVRRLNTQAVFIHVPLAPGQILGERIDQPSLPVQASAAAIRLILAQSN